MKIINFYKMTFYVKAEEGEEAAKAMKEYLLLEILDDWLWI
jgi:hypothetical protein